MTPLGNRIRRLMQDQALSAAQIGDRAGIAEGTVKAIVSGRIERPPNNRLQDIAVALGVTSDELINLVDHRVSAADPRPLPAGHRGTHRLDHAPQDIAAALGVTSSNTETQQQETAMIINNANLNIIYTGFKTVFGHAFKGYETTYERVAMVVPSDTREELYGWFGEFPNLREWIGDRVIKNLTAHSYTIKNRKFEHTVSVPRDDLSDDRHGTFAPYFSEMGRLAATHPEELVYGLLATGFETQSYDGQNFFDTEHPVGVRDGKEIAVSNMQAGKGPAWFLLDTSRMVKPLVFQRREPYEMQSLDQTSDENVFMRDEYLYGVRARVNAGFGLWQLAFASKAELNAANYEAARAAMQSLTADGGRKLHVRPDVLVVPEVLEGPARRLIKNGTRVETVKTGEASQAVALANEWQDTAELIVTPYL